LPTRRVLSIEQLSVEQQPHVLLVVVVFTWQKNHNLALDQDAVEVIDHVMVMNHKMRRTISSKEHFGCLKLPNVEQQVI
jgi:uncharacterized protein YeaC (DUF1315 family)